MKPEHVGFYINEFNNVLMSGGYTIVLYIIENV